LKNFTSIRKALSPSPDGSGAAWTPRGLRVVFLLGGWKEGVEITDDLVKAGRSWEEKLTNFFLKATDMKRNPSSQETSRSAALQKALEDAKTSLHAALCDSFHTPQAMQIISALVTEANSVLNTESDATTTIEIATWLTRIVTIFGLNGPANHADSTQIGWEGVEIPIAAQPFVYPLSQLRDEVRRQARSTELSHEQIAKLVSDSPSPPSTTGSEAYAVVLTQFRDDVKKAASASAPAKEFLQLCDTLRDTHLWDLDIYLEDRDGPGGAMVRPLDSSLKQARAEKEQRDQEKREAKAKRDREEAEKKRLKDEAAKVDPKTMFQTAEYKEWDADGVPIKDKDGEELSKAKRKKLLKEYENQKKNHEKWLKSQGS
jgi:cysteinyl-tRNA synthetase